MVACFIGSYSFLTSHTSAINTFIAGQFSRSDCFLCSHKLFNIKHCSNVLYEEDTVKGHPH